MFKQTGIVRPLGLALLLALGFGAVFAVVVAWGVTIWESLRQREQFNESLVVRWDGTPLIQRSTYNYGYQTVTYRALDGSEVPKPKENEYWLAAAYLSIPRRGATMFPLSGSARIGRFGEVQEPFNFWYFVDDGARDGHGYFVGYDGQSKLCLGFIGRNGFCPDRPPVEEWFPMDGVKLANRMAFTHGAMGPYSYYGYYGLSEDRGEFPTWKVDMISGNQLLEVDLRKRSVTTFTESPDMIAVGILDTVTKAKAVDDESPRFHWHKHLAVRTTDRVLVFDAPGKQGAAYLLPEGLRERSFAFYVLDAGTALVAVRDWHPERGERDELTWIDTSGKVLRPFPGERAEVALGQGNPHYTENEAWKATLIVPAPAITAFLAAVAMPLEHWAGGWKPDYSTALAHSLAAFWPPLLVVTLLAAVLAWYCFRRHRRYHQRSSVVWFVFVLLLGVPGLVGYLFHRRWPVLENCPACGQDVPRDRETCANCGVAFPPPPPKGCEVFA